MSRDVFSKQITVALDFARRSAKAHAHETIEPVRLLRALLEDPASTAGLCFASLGVDFERARRSVDERIEARGAGIVVSAIATVGLSAFTAVTVMWLGLSSNDGAYAWPAPMLFVLSVSLLFVWMLGGFASAVGVPLALLTLRSTRLRRSIPIVAGVAVAFTGLFSVLDPLLGGVAGIVGAVVALVVVAVVPALRESSPERRRLAAPASATQHRRDVRSLVRMYMVTCAVVLGGGLLVWVGRVLPRI